MSRRTSTVLFVIGIVLLVFGVLVYLTGWFFLYGIFIVALGAVLVLITNKPWPLKIPVVAIPIFFVAWSFSASHASAQTILIPEGYVGKFCIVYGEHCGAPNKEVDGRYMVEIPSDGIAIVQREFEAGWVDDEYRFVDRSGASTRARHVFDMPKGHRSGPVVMLGASGAVGGQLPGGGGSTEAPGAIRFTEFHVFGTDSTTDYLNIGDDLLTESMKARVEECRSRLQ